VRLLKLTEAIEQRRVSGHRACEVRARQSCASLDFLDTLGPGLVVDAARMRANLEAHGPEGRAPDSEAAVDELLAGLARYL